MGADKMDGHSDFFNRYVMSVVEMSFQFYFLVKILKKKIWPPLYFLCAVCAVIVCDFISVNTIAGFVTLSFLLAACGTFVCHADFRPSLLYAPLTIEIMLLCYGIVESLMGLLSSWVPAFFNDTADITVMLAGEAASLALTGFCYYMVYRYFSRDALYPGNNGYSFYAAAEMQQIFLVFIPLLMIFIMSKYINTIAFEFRYEILEDEGPSGYLFSHWKLLAMQLFGLASLFSILFSYKKLQQNFRLSTELSLLEQEEHSLNQSALFCPMRWTMRFMHVRIWTPAQRDISRCPGVSRGISL